MASSLFVWTCKYISEIFCFAQRSKTWFSSFVPVKVKRINYNAAQIVYCYCYFYEVASVLAKSKLFIFVYRVKNNSKEQKDAKCISSTGSLQQVDSHILSTTPAVPAYMAHPLSRSKFDHQFNRRNMDYMSWKLYRWIRIQIKFLMV